MGLATLALTGSAAGARPADDPAWADQPGPRQIGLPQVWETTTGDPSVVIATIDTGANVIPDLEGRVRPGLRLRRQRLPAGGHARPRVARRERDRRPRQQQARHGRSLLGLPGDADPRQRRTARRAPARIAARDQVRGRSGRADHQRQPEPCRYPGCGGGGGGEVRDRPRRGRGRVGGERGHETRRSTLGPTPVCSPWARPTTSTPSTSGRAAGPG